MKHRSSLSTILFRLALLPVWIVGLVAPASAAPAAAPPAALTNTVKLSVVSARTEPLFPDASSPTGILKGATVSTYKFLINKDDTGNPGQATSPDCKPQSQGGPADYPANCDWPSIHSMRGGTTATDEIVTQGDQSDIDVIGGAGINLPNGDYFVSVFAEGFRIDGQWFSVPLNGPVEVQVQPDPLPLATIRIQVFADTQTNGQFDPQVEQGLAGFVGHINDVLAEVTTDWFGNPLCTQYDVNGDPIPGSGGKCLSDSTGQIVIPNLGSNRYAVSVVPPDGQSWIQTTTLEGSHDWDQWSAEGDPGYDPELIVNGGAVPVVQAGFVQPMALSGSATGRITGRVVGVKSYLPPAGGDTFEGPIYKPWVALTDLLRGDAQVYAGRGNADGTFDIQHVPNSDYSVAFWDQDQNYLLGVSTVVVANGQVVNMGDFAISHWFSQISGTVFIDNNRNGIFEPGLGERGLQGQSVVLKSRDNSIVDAGTTSATTDINGHYNFPQVYPYGYWTVEEFYNDRFYTTGATYQADNGPEVTVTTQGGFVDVPVLNQDGISSRLDWGVHPYETDQTFIDQGFPTNGGIVGTVVYNATRNEVDARLSATEDYEAGISGITVNLDAPVPCEVGVDAGCVPTPSGQGGYLTIADTNDPNYGAYVKGEHLGDYISETFIRPTDCEALNADGVPFSQLVLPPSSGGHDCLDAPLMGNQIKAGEDFPAVNGNYGFGDLQPGDYLVGVDIPTDDFGNPMYKVSKEEDINVFNGDQFVPAVPPPPCAGALHTVHVVDNPADAQFDPSNPAQTSGVYNPGWLDAGGSPYEDQRMPLCDTQLVTVNNGRSIVPIFSLFTDVPAPGRLFGAMVEDLALSTDPKELFYGEKAGIPNAPIGVYDFSGRLAYTIHTDPNGFFEVLLPSASSYNCPLPAGPCPTVWRLVGNDPGQPGNPNPDYNPQYRTLTSYWQVWPNLTLLADVALLPTANVLEIPGTQNNHPAQCLVNDPASSPSMPELFAVSQPYVNGMGAFSIYGQGFGAQGSNSKVMLDSTALTINTWSDSQIGVTVSGVAEGPHQLTITADNGKTNVNGLTFHVRGGSYNPTLYEVGPGKTYSTIQAALNAAAGTAQALVVVYPNTPGSFTPLGDYYESIVMHSPAKLQGVGPGGVRSNGSHVLGSIINGLGFANTNFTAWNSLVTSLTWAGNQNIYEGQVVYVLAPTTTSFTAGYKASIDGFNVKNGDEFGYPSTQAFHVVQGGGIFVNAYARYLQITNNVVESNGGSFGGGIRIGTPFLPGANHDNQNDNILIAHNRIFANGGSNLAGAVGLFYGTENYEIANNDICGNFSAEYGGGISHFGLSPNGSVHNNRIYFNGSYDEGAGIMIAGEPEAVPTQLSTGSGPVSVYANLIQSNLSNDDGGGLRFLEAGNFPMKVYNNMIVNNVATHEGGGVALDDAPAVRFYHNTVMKNITTATSAGSDGNPAPAGLSTGKNSVALQATLGGGAANFSNPLQFNNIFWDNRAGTWDDTNFQLVGIGAGDANYWDMGTVDGSGPLTPTNSLLQQNIAATDGASSGSNKYGQDPSAVSAYDTSLLALPWRGDPHFFFNVIIALDVPPSQLGDYHVPGGSPAVNMGAASKTVGSVTASAPCVDIDNDGRPNGAGFDAGADEQPGVTPNCPTMHIGDLDGTKVNVDATHWRAIVTVTVHDNNHNLLPGVKVNVNDLGDNSRINNCTTSNVIGPDFGTCKVQSGSIPNSTASVTFSVSSVTNSLPYKPGDNHDPDGDSTGTNITVSQGATIHVGDLDASIANVNPTNWRSTVTVTVHDGNHNPVQSATVNGSWSAGSGGSTNCTTNSLGQCNLTRTLNKNANPTVTFTVSNLTRSGFVYSSSNNHDPDGEPPTPGTAIAISLPTMHVGDLDWTSSNITPPAIPTQWQATVTITVHDSAHNPVAGATVNVSWANGPGSGSGGSGGASCTTNGSGQCTVTRTGISRNRTSTTATVSSVTHATVAISYQSSANHDPDVGAQASNGTTISVPRP